MMTWTAETTVDARPDEVIDVLTDPAAALRWSPFPFDLEDFPHERLEAGDAARISGALGGMRVSFALDVHEAGDGRLALTARGPIDIDVLYEIQADRDGASDVRASVSVAGRGLRGRALAKATDALLAAGALGAALGRIAREAERLAVV